MTFVVDSQQIWNDSGIDLERGAQYRVDVSGQWFDAGHPAGADGWPGTTITNFFVWLRRARDLPWSALVGCVDRRESYFHLRSGTFTAVATGRLYCFANDARGFYGNNTGSLHVTLERLP